MRRDGLRACCALGLLSAAALLAAAIRPAPAATFFVDANSIFVDPNARSGLEDGCVHPYRTINAAISGALTRNAILLTGDPNVDRDRLVDEILVLPGLYRERVTLPSGLCLRAWDSGMPSPPSDPNACEVMGPGGCPATDLARRPVADPNGVPDLNLPFVHPIIHGGGLSPVVLIQSASSGTVLDGFAITGGAGTLGAGLFLQGGLPRITNNIVYGNIARGRSTPAEGAGVFINGEATFEGNIVTGNLAVGGSGGGIAIAGGSPLIARNVIRGNQALSASDAYFGYGGGIAVDDAAVFPIIRNNIIVGNRADAGGGGIDVYRSSPFIVHNVITGNRTEGVGTLRGNGAGLNVVGDRGNEENTSPSIVNNVLTGNAAAGSGGGLSVSRSRPVTAGNDFFDNLPDDAGGPRSPVGLDLNVSVDPALDPGLEYAPAPTSPLIDAGSDGVLLLGNDADGDPSTRGDRLYRRRVLVPPDDLPGAPRPVDADAGGGAEPDVGAHELSPSSDPNDPDADGVPSDADPNTTFPCVPDPNGVFAACDDNCPVSYNPSQLDADGDGAGDACDNCPLVRNGPCRDRNGTVILPDLCDVDGSGSADPNEIARGNQSDIDLDLVGDLCDADRDNDGIPNDDPNAALPCAGGRKTGCDDNCPDVTNATQRDRDHDGVGDACDNCLRRKNGDCGLDSSFCYVDPNTGAMVPSQADSDRDPNTLVAFPDGFGDACDNCRDTPNGICSASDTSLCDANFDGTMTSAEAGLGNQRDSDNDRMGDACDDDRDGDDVPEDFDADPNTVVPCVPDPNGAFSACDDNCPFRRNPSQDDSDSDGAGDPCDNCDFARNGPCKDPNGVVVLPDLCDVDVNGSADPNEIATGNQINTDRDKEGDACDTDDDNDGIPDDAPQDPNGTVAWCVPDPNGVFASCDDNCRLVFNSTQANMDGDPDGDACDPDRDGDGIAQDGDGDGFVGLNLCTGGATSGCDDNCPADYNPAQEDADGDTFGDACDTCPLVPNSLQEDFDGDANTQPDPNAPAVDPNTLGGDACDTDRDADGVPEDADGDPSTALPCAPDPNGVFAACDDNCPDRSNSTQVDADADALGGSCDNCPDVRNGDCGADPLRCDADGDGVADAGELLRGNQADADFDGAGDACDEDTDGDGVPEDGDGSGLDGDRPCKRGTQKRCDDNCPGLPNPAQKDSDDDGAGDLCDPDADGDLVPEDDPNAAAPCAPGQITGCDDNCPTAYNPTQADADADGRGDPCDSCPADGSARQADEDGDGWGDACDDCPAVYNPAQADADGDGTGDACEGTSLALSMSARAGTEGVLRPDAAVRVEIIIANRTSSGERVDLTVELREPDASGARKTRALVLDAFAGQETRTRLGLRLPHNAPSGAWTLTAKACPTTLVLDLPGRTPDCPNGSDPLLAAVAVTVK